MAPDLLDNMLGAAISAIRENAEALTALDQAIGDGDHGINMTRGFTAIEAERAAVAAMALPQALQKIGMTLVMNVGGASGPLYGSYFMAVGKALPPGPLTGMGVAEALTAGAVAVQKRGKSAPGEKTMLDVLVPVADAVNAAAQANISITGLLTAVRTAAESGLESTRDMLALRGRASYLGERSIGHLDPGAQSSLILVQTICDVVTAALTAMKTEDV
ncbi:MAG: dihydroxyacetone kinase subunit DhaL [Alphaproteobacteria bacterium]